MSSTSIRYDVSTISRLIRAVPVVALYLLIMVIVFFSMPEKAQELPFEAIMAVGFIGLVRYLWVLTHCVRAVIYEHYMYPKMQFEAEQLPPEVRTPKRVFVIIPTSGEKPDVSRRMLGRSSMKLLPLAANSRLSSTPVAKRTTRSFNLCLQSVLLCQMLKFDTYDSSVGSEVAWPIVWPD